MKNIHNCIGLVKIIFWAWLLTPYLSMGQSQNRNYLKSVSYKVPSSAPLTDPEVADANTTLNYYDGLGRPVQQVAFQQSGVSSKSIITPITYDEFGRQVKENLPYLGGTTMAFDTGATGSLLSFYSNPSQAGDPNFEITTNPYSEKAFEASPLNRILKQAAPGNSWALGSGHEVQFDYQTNIAAEVRLFKAATSLTSGIYTAVLVENNSYDPGQLYKTITKDENWTNDELHTTEEFKDKDGKVVLKRAYNDDGTYDTYYVYDNYGNLTFVLPPKVDLSSSITNQLEGLCYQYRYDHRNRLAEKQLPGKSLEFIVYDRLDRALITGPALNPFTGDTTGCIFTKYDVFGRVCFTGWFPSTQTRALLQSSYNGSIDNAVRGSSTIDGITIGYAPCTYPTGLKLLSVNYYDNYQFMPFGPATLPPTSSNQPVLTTPKGLLTGTWIRVLTKENLTDAEAAYTLYNHKSKPILVQKENYLGGFTQISTVYNFTGQPLHISTRHRRTASATTVRFVEEYEYTDQGRLLNNKHTIDSGITELIAHHSYNELGNLIGKSLMNDMQTVNFSYNVRGWLTQINDIDEIGQDLFAFKINYNTLEINSAGTELFNGNISQTLWKASSDNIKRQYSFEYDPLNRLTAGIYHKPDFRVIGNYDEYLIYDKGGNILNLDRTGNSDLQGFNHSMDNLQYTYDTTYPNRLNKVTDDSNDSNGFKDGVNTGNDYIYDSYGNMTADYNKAISSIVYNHLNLPIWIQFATGKIYYIYDATGKKVRKVVQDDVTNVTTTTDYLDGFQYKNNKLQFFPTAEGYVNYTQSENAQQIAHFNYVYNYLDHLGNIRLSYGVDPSDGLVKVLEENHYYPFGLKHTNYNDDKKKYINEDSLLKIKPVPQFGRTEYDYKYNGKEWQDELGLNQYDYGARSYDPAIGRWLNIDPLAEQGRRWSPYKYCNDNPVRFVDPDGMSENDDWIRNNETGEYSWDNNVTSAANTPTGSTYVGANDSDIIKDIGFTSSYAPATTTKMGFVASDMEDSGAVNYGVSHLTTVTAETNIRVSADVTTSFDANGGLAKTFNGVAIDVSVKGTATGTDNIAVTGMATTSYNGQTYSAGLQAPDGSQSLIQQAGTTSASGTIMLPAAQVSAYSGVQVFPSVNVSGNWQNVKEDGSGAAPVTIHGMVPIPRTYSHTYLPYSGNQIKK